MSGDYIECRFDQRLAVPFDGISGALVHSARFTGGSREQEHAYSLSEPTSGPGPGERAGSSTVEQERRSAALMLADESERPAPNAASAVARRAASATRDAADGAATTWLAPVSRCSGASVPDARSARIVEGSPHCATDVSPTRESSRARRSRPTVRCCGRCCAARANLCAWSAVLTRRSPHRIRRRPRRPAATWPGHATVCSSNSTACGS